jgi:type VI protein secretion system component Hcp
MLSVNIPPNDNILSLTIMYNFKMALVLVSCEVYTGHFAFKKTVFVPTPLMKKSMQKNTELCNRKIKFVPKGNGKYWNIYNILYTIFQC